MAVTLSTLTERRNLWPWLLLAPLAVYLALFFLVPLAEVAIMSVTEPRPGLANYEKVLTGSLYRKVFLNTFATAALVTVCCLLVGYPLAYLMNATTQRRAMMILLLITMSFWTSFLVRTYAWMVLLGNNGPVIWLLETIGFEDPPGILFTRFSSTLAMVHILAPYMIMNIYSVMQKIDRSLIRSAESMGAYGLSLFRHVYLPLTAPGIANGSVLVFVICLGFYVTPVLLGSPREQMAAGLIGHQIEEFLAFGLGSAMAIVLLVVTLIVLAIYSRRFGLDKLYG
ncbi:ABC transporter permease [Pseudoruegeria sp. HB172150]|uniref:ABC transporter permease n=1 Tax=Pseudoruegeria sp. HB172150 TaxID=2721164 RepID=UPI001556D585|nr:ABC transporter permease [Pseudoruegeria sp. HB172150]